MAGPQLVSSPQGNPRPTSRTDGPSTWPIAEVGDVIGRNPIIGHLCTKLQRDKEFTPRQTWHSVTNSAPQIRLNAQCPGPIVRRPAHQSDRRTRGPLHRLPQRQPRLTPHTPAPWPRRMPAGSSLVLENRSQEHVSSDTRSSKTGCYGITPHIMMTYTLRRYRHPLRLGAIGSNSCIATCQPRLIA